MTTNELAEYCRNLRLLRDIRDSDDPIGEKNAITLNERLRSGRGRIQDVYRKAKDRMEAVVEYGRTALGEDEFDEARKEVDDAPPEPKKPVGRPAKPKTEDLPGQGDIFADQAAEIAREAEEARRQEVGPDLALDLEILKAMRESRTYLGTPAIAQKLGLQPSDVAVRLAALEQAGRIRQEFGLWEVTKERDKTSPKEAPNSAPESGGYAEGPPASENGQEDPARSPEGYAQRMEAYAEAARAILADGPVTNDPLIRAIAQRTGQAQTAVKEAVMGWLSGDGKVIERDGPRGPWRLRTGAELVEAPPL